MKDREELKQFADAAEAIRRSDIPQKEKTELLANVAEAIERNKKGGARRARLAARLKVSPKFINFLLWNLILMVLVFVVVAGGF